MNRLILLIACLALLAGTAYTADPIPTRDITMRAGADYRLLFSRKYNGQPIDLTGCNYYGQFRGANGELFANFSSNAVTPTTSGRISVRLSHRQTLKLSGKAGIWDLLEVNSSGVQTYIMGGKASVLPTQTRVP